MYFYPSLTIETIEARATRESTIALGCFHCSELQVTGSVHFSLEHCSRDWVTSSYLTPGSASIPLQLFLSECKYLSYVMSDSAECKPGVWKRSFFCGSGSAKIPPLPLPHGREEWREKRNWVCYPSEQRE